MNISDQLHATAALPPTEKAPGICWTREGWAPDRVWKWCREKSLLLLGIELILPNHTALSLVNIHISRGFYKLIDNMKFNGRITASEEL
jgi:hypothetical protein